MEVSTLGECSIDTDFLELPLSLTFTFVICHPGGVILGSEEFQTNESNTEMARKATAGAPACERVTMTFDKQRCQHITISRVVERV